MSLALLREELDELAATSVQRQKLETDVPKALAAIAKAREVGAKRPLSYAMSVFNSPTTPSPTQATNRSVAVDCKTCDGDRMVVYSTRTDTYNGHSAEVEEYAPCPDCNANANTLRHGFRSPDPAQVRARLNQ